MEKRTILAVALSFFILLAYNSMVAKYMEKTRQDKPDVSQPVDIKHDVVKDLIKPPAESAKTEAITQVLPKEDIQHIENKSVIVETSNVDGAIKRVTDKEPNYVFPITNILSSDGYNN